MEPILVSREIASDPIKLYEELKRRGIEFTNSGRMKLFSIQPDPENPDLFWVSASNGVTGSVNVETKESEKEPQTVM